MKTTLPSRMSTLLDLYILLIIKNKGAALVRVVNWYKELIV